ncbi:MAG: sulfatase family protein [Micromonosporaceae bacterium]
MWVRLKRLGVAVTTALLAGALLTSAATAVTPARETAGEARPNIVYILTDDMSADLIPYATEALRLRRDGLTFPNFVYANSLCCPSRASILSGRFPHNTGVLTNNSKHHDGGMGAFLDDEDRALPVQLQEAGYRTGLMGKYLNEYRPVGSHPDWWYDYPADYVPPGWDEWHGVGPGGYGEMEYDVTQSVDGVVRRQQSDEFANPYLTDVLSDKAVAFLERSSTEHPGQPFFLEVATFAPHPVVGGGFVPAPRDRANPGTGFPGDCGPVDCGKVRAPRTPAFNADTSDKPEWVRREPLTADEIAVIDQKFLLRVQMMQAINDMIRTLRAKLVELGAADNTYLVFGSDNGFHLGQHRLNLDGGKSTAYEYDSVVPLTVVGPGVAAGTERDELVQNVDLFSTFQAIAGRRPAPNDGHSVLGLLKGAEPESWLRDAAYIEYTSHDQPVAGDPDAGTQGLNRNPPTYRALRTATETYVEYETGELEYYDLTADPYQLRNTADELPERRRAELHDALDRLSRCGTPDGPGCWGASALG